MQLEHVCAYPKVGQIKDGWGNAPSGHRIKRPLVHIVWVGTRFLYWEYLAKPGVFVAECLCAGLPVGGHVLGQSTGLTQGLGVVGAVR